LVGEHHITKTRAFFLSKVATASFIGGLLEWYDFYIFATASALVLGKLFFPGGDPLAGTMAAFGTFASGFLARPIGGIVFGHIGDRLGRKASLIATLLIIGVGTFLIGCLPTYQQIGSLAPVLLVILRVVQGIGLGGEYGGASLMMIEHAPPPDRGFWGSLPQAASPAGLLLATASFGLVSLLPDEKFWSWGWRLPFLTSAVAMIIGYFIRIRLAETPEFEDAKKSASKKNERAPITELLRTHLYNTFLATGARLAETVSGNMIKSFGLTYATMVLGFQKEIPLNALTGTAVIGVIVMPLFGMLGDRFGQRYVYMAGTLFAAAVAFPFFWLLDFRTPVALWLGFAIAFNLGPTLMLSVQPTFFTQLFDTRVRYTGLSVAYQVSAIIGGFIPLISLWTLRISNNTPWLTAGILAAVALLSLTCAGLAILRRQPRQQRRSGPRAAHRGSA
jgi:MHS family shikimate/dehydroshikimate transporter-like MFS transporter